MKKIIYIIISALILSLSACSGNNDIDDSSNDVVQESNEANEKNDLSGSDSRKDTEDKSSDEISTPAPTTVPLPWDGAYIEKEKFIEYTLTDLMNIYDSINNQLSTDDSAAIKELIDKGSNAIKSAQTVGQVNEAYSDAIRILLNKLPIADGTQSFNSLNSSEKSDLMGVLEEYGIANGLTGITICEDSSYIMFHPRIILGSDKYISGYGFGILSEGSAKHDLVSETNEAWKRYYHYGLPSDPGTLNALRVLDREVGELYENIAAQFARTFMNSSKDGYEWVPELAKEKPQPVNDDDGDGICTIWRMEIKTGDDGLRYRTGSSLENRKAFDGRPVELKDYEYAFKLLLTQANRLSAGEKIADLSDYLGIKGAKEFYEATSKGYSDSLWENVGIKTYNENGKNYFQVTFTEPQSMASAMYNISAAQFMPIPEAFINLVSVENYLGFSEDGRETPVDNSLSLGPYYIEKYDKDQQIVFAKNPYYTFSDTKYTVEGIHIRIFPEAVSDKTAMIKEFFSGKLDSAVIPKDYLEKYKDDFRTREAGGKSNFKLNINSCDEQGWNYLFGPNGVLSNSQEDESWTVKPVLANSHFRKALSLSINRTEFANLCGSKPSVDFLTAGYIVDLESGKAYNDTNAHKSAVEQLINDTDGYGYSLEKARDYFRMALTELEHDGIYKPGTKDAPTEITLEIAWMFDSDEEDFHNLIKKYLETAFNEESVCKGVYKLNVNFWSGEEWSDVYYKKIMTGKYDLAYGSLSGNMADPLSVLKTLSSNPDISEGYTLSFGINTSDADVYPLVYNGHRWSFDALCTASLGAKG